MTVLGDLVEIFDGPHATPTRRDSGPYFLNISSLKSGRLDLGESDHVSEEDFVRWTRRMQPRVGDLLFSYETRLGEAALMPDDVRACLGRRMGVLRPNRALLEPRYLLYYFLSPSFQELISERTVHGATVPRLLLSEMGAWPIEVPDLATQTAIADVLGALDDKIAANERIIRVSEDLLRTRFLRECDQAERTCRVADILDFNPPRPRPLDDEPIYVEMKDLGTHTSVITSWSRRAPLGGVRFQRGDTVMGRITPCLENGKVGYVDFLREGEIGIGSTEFIAMATRDGLPKPLSFLVAEHPGFRQEAVQLMVGTSGRQRVSARDLGEIELQLPDDGTLRELGRAAEAVFELLARLRDENRSLAATRDALLPDLMSGRLTVGEVA